MPPSTILHLDNIVAELRRSPASVEHLHRHHAVVLTELSLNPLLDQEFEGRHRAERVLKTEVSYVRYLDRLDREDFRLHQPLQLTLPLSVYEGTWTHSPPLVAMHLLDRSCVIVGNFLKLHATFPNTIHQPMFDMSQS